MKNKAISLQVKAVLAILSITLLATSASGATYKVLHNFGGSPIDGTEPVAGLVIDQDGNLHGTTVFGGARGGGGTAFELTLKEDGFWTETMLHNFGQGDRGAYPTAGLIFDSSGNLYGTTIGGGTHGYGTVFELSPAAGGKWTETVLHNFNGEDGANPEDSGPGLVFDKAGNLYGTTYSGGAKGWGAIFEIDTHGQAKVLHSFDVSVDGANPLPHRSSMLQAICTARPREGANHPTIRVRSTS